MKRLQLATLAGVLAGCTGSSGAPPSAAPEPVASEPCTDFYDWVCSQSPPVLPSLAERQAAWSSAPSVELAYAADPVLAAHREQCLTGEVGDAAAAMQPWLERLASAKSGTELLALSGALEAEGLPGLFRLAYTADGPALVPSMPVALRAVSPDGMPMPKGGWRGVELHVTLANSQLETPVEPERVKDGLVALSQGAPANVERPFAEAVVQAPGLQGWAAARGVQEDAAPTVTDAALALVAQVEASPDDVVQALRFLLWASLSGLGDAELDLQSATLGMIWGQGVGLDDVLSAEQRCAGLLSERVDVVRAQAVIEQAGLPLAELTEQVREAYAARIAQRYGEGSPHEDSELESMLAARLQRTEVFVGSAAGAQPLPDVAADRVASELARRRRLASWELGYGLRPGPPAMHPTCVADQSGNGIYCGLPALLPSGASTEGASPEVTALVSEMLAHEWTHLIHVQVNDGLGPSSGWVTPASRALAGASACLAESPSEALDDSGLPGRELSRVWSEAHADHMGLRVGLTAWHQLGHSNDQVFFAAVASSSCDAPTSSSGPYLPNAPRVNRGAAVSSAFREAFACGEETVLGQEPVCDVW